MPRSGTGEYSTPLGVLAQPGFTIESAKYNLNVNDVANDLNSARPIVAGGTSATNANEALVNLKGERSYQLITNYNSDRFHPGSFASAPDAVGSPIAGHQFAGVCYTLDAPPTPSSAAPPNDDVGIEARDFDDTAQPQKKYVRVKRSGTWGAWYVETFAAGGSTVDTSKVLKSGDTMTGPLILNTSAPSSALQAASKGYVDSVAGGGGGGGGGLDQATADARYVNVTGDILTGFLTLGGDPVLPAHAATKAYVDTHAASGGNFVPLNGSVPMTGPLTLSGAPVNTLHAATKAYVDSKVVSGGGTDPTKVPLAGTTAAAPMTGGLQITTANNTAIVLDNTANSGMRSIIATRNQSTRWIMEIGDAVGESGGNNGSDFAINAYSDGGGFIFKPLYIKRSTGNILTGADLYVTDSLNVGLQAFKPGGGPFASSGSDARIKTELSYYTDGLSKVKQLEPVRYTYKGNDVPLTQTPSAAPGQPDPKSPHYKAAQTGTQFTGLIAQEAEEVMPEMVTQVSAYIDGVMVNDMRTLDTTPLIYCLINAIKELAARVESLEAAP